MNKRWYYGPDNGQNKTIIKKLRDVFPSYADHMYDNNRELEAFFNSSLGGIDFFNQPVCKMCFRPGMLINDKTFQGPDHYIGDPSIYCDIIKHVEELKAADEYDVYFRPSINCFCEIHGMTKDTKTVREYLIEDLKIPAKAMMELEFTYYGGKL